MSYSETMQWTCDLCGVTASEMRGNPTARAAAQLASMVGLPLERLELLPPGWSYVQGRHVCKNHKILVDPPEEKPEPESEPSHAGEWPNINSSELLSYHASKMTRLVTALQEHLRRPRNLRHNWALWFRNVRGLMVDLRGEINKAIGDRRP